MKNRGIVIFLIVLAIVIVGVIAGDFLSKRPDKMEANPFNYDIEEFKNVDKDLILYKETKNFKVGFKEAAGIAIENDSIFLAGDQVLKVIDKKGNLIKEISLPDKPHTVEVNDGSIYVAFEKGIGIFDRNSGELIKEWKLNDENSFVTSIAVHEENIFIADAGSRKILHYSKEGEKINEFEGKSSEDVLHGFIIPSPYFDIDFNDEGELWVVNPGLHQLENYTFDGALRSHWKNSSMKTEGFSGCCNPAHYTFLQDGSYVTSEKGLVRIKVYKPSGEFLGVVAPPDRFEDKIEGNAPDVATDSEGNIYALDFDRNVLRVFELK